MKEQQGNNTQSTVTRYPHQQIYNQTSKFMYALFFGNWPKIQTIFKSLVIGLQADYPSYAKTIHYSPACM